MNLRDYQITAVERVISSVRGGSRPVLVAPTGSGKTVMGVEAVNRISVPTLWIAHREELIDQAVRALEPTGAMIGVIKSGHPMFALAPIQVASLQTLVRRLDSIPPCSLVVVDECHHAASESYKEVFQALGDTPSFGLTATPFRLDGKPLNTWFNELVIAAYPHELVEQGFLINPKVYSGHETPDLSKLRITGGDYNAADLNAAVKDEGLVGDIVENWMRLANGKRTICFAASIEHSRSIVERFTQAGVSALHVDGKDLDNQRSMVNDLLRSGKVKVVSNCMLFTEGWDLPELECAILARPTASLALHLQMLGRIMRSAHGKTSAIVLDHAGNHDLHGLATTKLIYSLEGKVKRESEELGLRMCPKCYLLFSNKSNTCPECGHVIEKEKRDADYTEKSADLVELDAESFEFRQKQRFYAIAVATANARGYQPGWVARRFQEKFGEWPMTVHGQLVNPKEASYFEKMTLYHQFLSTARSKGFADGWASHKYKEIFGCWPTGFVSAVKTVIPREGVVT